MRIVHISAEVAHYAKVGGLGDVVYDLADIFSKNHCVEVIIPLYRQVDPQILCDADRFQYPFFFEKIFSATAIQTQKNNIRITLIQIGALDYFDRERIYGFTDDADRFACFCAAASEYVALKALSERIDVIHIHDWHSALTAALLKTRPSLSKKIVLTIHNFSHKGYCPTSVLAKTSLSKHNIRPYQLARNPNVCCLLKGGILESQVITTVSPGYSKEMLLDNSDEEILNALNRSKDRFQGILNGINTEYWNPETDDFIKHKYPSNPAKISQIIRGKTKNKKFITKKFRLSRDEIPLICVISRLVHQKGLHFMLEALEMAEQLPYKMVVLGQCGDAHSEQLISNIQTKLQGSKKVAFHLQYDERLAHQVYAGSDMILIPSIFEPCGLTQLIGMRYGTIPLVRKTGGLGDTVTHLKNGFVFSEADSPNAFSEKIQEAIYTYHNAQDTWRNLIYEGMAGDYSWNQSWSNYLNIYSSFRSE